MAIRQTNASCTVAFVLLSVAVLQLSFAFAALAEVKIIRMKHVGYDDLKSKCAAEGGEFDSVGKSDYWCSKGGSHVICNTKQCTGATGTPAELNRRLEQLHNPNTTTEMLTPQ